MQKRGLFQQLFPATGAWSEGFFCFGGLVLVMSLHVFPFLMTMLKNAMLNISASLEESGAVFGAVFGLWLRKIFAPLLTGNDAIGALLVFVKTLSEYGTPYTLGRRNRILCVHHRHPPLLHHRAHRLRPFRQPVLCSGLHLYGNVADAELHHK